MENQKILINKFLEIPKESTLKERVAIFIDGSNFYYGLKRLNITGLKMQDLIDELVNNRHLIKIFFYTIRLDKRFNKNQFVEHNTFLDILKNIKRFSIVLCTLKRIRKPDGGFGFEVKGDDIHLANDMLVGAYENKYDTAILVSGDEDFIPVVNTIKVRLKKRVENIYFRKSSSRWLRKACTSATNARFILNEIEKKLRQNQKTLPSGN
ncbi:MAG: NYN domain-containing protein [Nanoarchaeota archaeon]|nr:NYN domain-containing protein [Nanoarchaeota archaeon]